MNENSTESLAAHAVNLISHIIQTQQQRQREGRPLERDLNEEMHHLLKYDNFFFSSAMLLTPRLIRILYEVEAFLQEQSKRSRLSRIVTYKADVEKLNSQRETLSQALAEFQVKFER